MFFFFSSRRRPTRWNCDWSSDVCSSDLEVQHLPDRARLPEQAPVERRPARNQLCLVLGDHAEGERALARDVLAAAHLRRELPRDAALEEIEREALGAARRRLPGEV